MLSIFLRCIIHFRKLFKINSSFSPHALISLPWTLFGTNHLFGLPLKGQTGWNLKKIRSFLESKNLKIPLRHPANLRLRLVSLPVFFSFPLPFTQKSSKKSIYIIINTPKVIIKSRPTWFKSNFIHFF